MVRSFVGNVDGASGVLPATTAIAPTTTTGGSSNTPPPPSPYSPLGVLLVSKDESAERVLFMYPFQPELSAVKRHWPSGRSYEEEDSKLCACCSSAAVDCCKEKEEAAAAEQRLQQSPGIDTESAKEARTFGLPVKMLAPLLQTKAGNKEGAPFEIKVDSIRFAGFPWCVDDSGSFCLAVVFILVDSHIVEAFQRLSRKIAVAVGTEQQRCNYLRDQISLMQPSHDEFEALSDGQRKDFPLYQMILEKSGLAQHLRDIFVDVCEYGMVDVFVNESTEVGFCVEPKAMFHAGLAPCSSAQLEGIMKKIRPYHGILFLEDSVPSPDSNPFILRFLESYEPTKSIEELASVVKLPLSQVLQIVRHYLLWARAIVFYPICASNVYANAERLPPAFKQLEASFNHTFPEFKLVEVLEAFSPPCTLGSYLQDVAIYSGRSAVPIEMIVYLLRNQLFIQLHTFFYIYPIASSKTTPPHDQKQQQQQNEEEHHQTQRLVSPRIQTCINASSELSDQLKEGLLAICSRAIRTVGVAEAEMFSLVTDFLRIAPFLNGRDHIEEIIYQLSIDRSTLMRLLDTFSEIVCPFQCQDLGMPDEDEE